MKAKTKGWKTYKIDVVFEQVRAMGATSQIYKLHGFVSNPCEICYFMGSYHLNMNVMHYLNTKDECTIFMCKQYE
jgi:hypothetical protein